MLNNSKDRRPKTEDQKISCRSRSCTWCFRFAAVLVSFRTENNEHLIPLHAGPSFNFTDVRQILLEFLQDSRSKFTVCHLTSAKPDRRLDFITFLEPFSGVLHPVAVIVVVSSGAKLHFLDRDRDLLLLRLVCLLLRLVLKFAKIDDATNGGISVRRNFNQIQSAISGGANRVAHIHNAKLFTLLTDYTHLRHANSFIDTYWRQSPVVRTRTATSKACSYCCTS